MDPDHGGRARVSVSVDGKTKKRRNSAVKEKKEILGF